MLFAVCALLFRSQNVFSIAVDTTLRAPLQTIFFTTIGLGATLSLLRAGGWQLPFFLLIASLMAVVQKAVGILAAVAMGAPAALGVICGSLTLTGGPATGLAFTGAFEQLGLGGAGALIIASATFGIFAASIVGNPVATWLIRRRRLVVPRDGEGDHHLGRATDYEVDRQAIERSPEQVGSSLETILKTLCLILVVMGAGAIISLGLAQGVLTLPNYIGAMVVAAAVRNLDDKFGWLRIDMRAVQIIGSASLALFLVIAL
ncbi:MAG: sodium/glutamate symporter, partial [Pyrinomonadaceae bacterium]